MRSWYGYCEIDFRVNCSIQLIANCCSSSSYTYYRIAANCGSKTISMFSLHFRAAVVVVWFFCVGSVHTPANGNATCCEVICNFIENETMGNMPYLFLFSFSVLFFFIYYYSSALHIPRWASCRGAGCRWLKTNSCSGAAAKCVISRVAAPFIENALRIIYAQCGRHQPHTPPLFIWTCCEDWRCDFDNKETLFRCSFSPALHFIFFFAIVTFASFTPSTPTYQVVTCDSDVRARHIDT